MAQLSAVNSIGYKYASAFLNTLHRVFATFTVILFVFSDFIKSVVFAEGRYAGDASMFFIDHFRQPNSRTTIGG